MDTNENAGEIFVPENAESNLGKEYEMSIHYTVGRLCEEMAKEYDVIYTKEFIAALAHIVYEEITAFTTDITLFSRHAKRTTITSDDVQLLVRKSPNLTEYMKDFCMDLANSRKNKRNGNALVTAEVIDDSSNSNFENVANFEPKE